MNSGPAASGSPDHAWASAADGPQYQVTLTKVTGFLVIARRRRVTYTGTVPQLHRACRKVLAHNLLFGWWGLRAALTRTPLALLRNHRARSRLRQQTAAATGHQHTQGTR